MADEIDRTESSQPGPGETADPAGIVAAAMAAYQRGDLEALAAFIHPEAEIEMFARQRDVALGPDGLRETLEDARKGVHRPTMTRIENVGADAAMMVGRIQYADPDRGGVVDRNAVWLTILREGLLWRTLVFGTPEEARAAYREQHAERSAR